MRLAGAPHYKMCDLSLHNYKLALRRSDAIGCDNAEHAMSKSP